MEYIRTYQIPSSLIRGPLEYNKRVYFELPVEKNSNFYLHNLQINFDNPEHLIHQVELNVNDLLISDVDSDSFHKMRELYKIENNKVIPVPALSDINYLSASFNKISCCILFQPKTELNNSYNFDNLQLIVDIYQSTDSSTNINKIDKLTDNIPEVGNRKSLVEGKIYKSTGFIDCKIDNQTVYEFKSNMNVKNTVLEISDTYNNLIKSTKSFTNISVIDQQFIKENFTEFENSSYLSYKITIEFTNDVTAGEVITHFIKNKHKIHADFMRVEQCQSLIRVKDRVTGHTSYTKLTGTNLYKWLTTKFNKIQFDYDNMLDKKGMYCKIYDHPNNIIALDIIHYPHNITLLTIETANAAF